MERRQFLTAGTGTILGLAGLGRAGASVQSEQDESDFDAFVSLLEANLGEMNIELIDAGHCLGNGVLATTTQAAGTTYELFAEEIGFVGGLYTDYLDVAESPPEIGLVVEVYESADEAGNREDRFARYAIDTTVAKEALATGDFDPLLVSMMLNVWPPMAEEFRDLMEDNIAGDGEPTQGEQGEEPAGSPSLELANHSVIDVAETTEDYGPSIAVDASIENPSDVRSGVVEFVIDWYDGDGQFLGTNESSLTTLTPGETWAARVYPVVDDGSVIADYQTSLIYDDPQNTILDGVSVVESRLTVGDEARIFGELANETGSELSYFEIVGRLLDADGRILDDVWTTESDISAGETWRFDLSYRDEDRARLNAIEEYELLVLA